MKAGKYSALILSLCLIVMVGMSLLNPSGIIATDITSQRPDFLSYDSFDTLDFNQDDYSSPAVSKLRDEEQVEAIIKGFLAANKASVREPSRYDLSAFLYDATTPDETVKYRLSETQYLTELNKAMGWEILRDHISFSQYSVLVNADDEMTVSIVEDYLYYITDDFDDESFRRREYTFDLVKANNVWKIVRIKTNDPWEVEDNFVCQPINVRYDIAPYGLC